MLVHFHVLHCSLRIFHLCFFPLHSFTSMANNIHIFGPTHVITLTFDHLFPTWFLQGCLFNPASVWHGLLLVYLLNSSPLPNYVAPLMTSRSLAFPLVLLLLLFFFFASGFKQGCSACKCAFEIRGCLSGFLISSHNVSPINFFLFCCFSNPFQMFIINSLILIWPWWECFRDFWVQVHWNALGPL